MLVGILADSHDHVDHTRRVVERFNAAKCDLVLHAGDFVSPIVVPTLRRLRCRLIGVWGDNDANRRAIAGGLRPVGEVHEPPYEADLVPGWRLIMDHRPLPKSLLEQCESDEDEPAAVSECRGRKGGAAAPAFDPQPTTGETPMRPAEGSSETRTLAVQAHTHHPGVRPYHRLLLLNPGEACGWVTGRATAALFNTETAQADIFEVQSGDCIQTIRLE